MEFVDYLLILVAATVAIASPGPATLAIAGTAMQWGRKQALALALGVMTGSFIWSLCAAFGLALVMKSNLWLFVMMKYLGAAYLLYLAVRAFRNALTTEPMTFTEQTSQSFGKDYLRGLLIHLTNPKAILFFTSLYSIGVPADAGSFALLSVMLMVVALGAMVFLGYAIVFSNALMRDVYVRSRRGFESLISVFFSTAGIKLLLSDLQP